MTTFFGGVFLNQETLKTAGINHPIKLEYYKRIDEDINKAKYGISIVKTEYEKGQTKVEEKAIEHLTNDEKGANYILTLLKENSVTPIGLDDVICDYAKKILMAKY